nr:uncharacterized protein LOC112717980 [Arachis hypogaea]
MTSQFRSTLRRKERKKKTEGAKRRKGEKKGRKGEEERGSCAGGTEPIVAVDAAEGRKTVTVTRSPIDVILASYYHLAVLKLQRCGASLAAIAVRALSPPLEGGRRRIQPHRYYRAVDPPPGDRSMKREREGARDAFSRIRSAVRRRNLCSVVISSRKQQNIDEAAEKLRAKGIEVLALVCHVSNDQQKKDLIQKIAQCASVLVYTCCTNLISWDIF